MQTMVDAKMLEDWCRQQQNKYSGDSDVTTLLAFEDTIQQIGHLSVEVPDTPKEEWVCGTCHGVVGGDFCIKCHPAETKRLSLTLEYLRVCRVLGEMRQWLEAEQALVKDAIRNCSGLNAVESRDRLTGDALRLGRALTKLAELQAKKE